MADEKQPRLNCRVSKIQLQIVKELQDSGIFGDNQSDVVRALLQRAIDGLISISQGISGRELRRGRLG